MHILKYPSGSIVFIKKTTPLKKYLDDNPELSYIGHSEYLLRVDYDADCDAIICYAPKIKGLTGGGATEEEAIRDWLDGLPLWKEAMLELGHKIPKGDG